MVGGEVFWTEQQTGNILSVPVGGGAVTTISTGWGNMGFGLIFVNGDLLWGSGAYNSGAPVPAPGTIGAWDSVTGAVTTVALAGQASNLASDGVSVYRIDNGDIGPGEASILKEPIAGGAITILASSILNLPAPTAPFGIAIDGTSVYWTSRMGVTKLSPK